MRNVARIKLGYYPLPQEEGKRLRKLLEFSAGTISVVDPCVGTGAALHQLTDRAEAQTVSSPTLVAADHSLLELDSELDALLDQIQDEIEEQDEASAEAMERFQLFCQAMDVKIDRIGRFQKVMETRAEYCKKESARYAARAKRAQNKI